MMKSRLVEILAWTALALLLAGVVAFVVAPRIESPKAPETRRAGVDTSGPRPKWAVRASRPGSDRPPAGRSLFDFVTTRVQDGARVQDIPFPFEALLERIDAHAGCDGGDDCLRVVLVPLGRSLQRLAAAPDFFAHPRIVAAVTGEGNDAAALLRNRLYIGYQEQSALLEVISYNEAAGRFEFQLVHDYRAGATPRVRYARREVCAACHQNLAPIFSRPLWAETNANPRVAAALAEHRDSFSGVPVDRGVDIPNAIDTATDRANMLGVWQALWHDGCGDDDGAGRRCRGAAVLAALQYRLGGERGFDATAPGWREDFLPVFARQWRARWPAGLAIPNPDLPSRDPLQFEGARPSGASLAHVPARFEPLLPRRPLEVWRAGAAAATDAGAPDAQLDAIARRFVAGLGEYFTVAELDALDRQLYERAVGAGDDRRQYVAGCRIDRDAASLRFRCEATPDGGGTRLAGRLSLEGGHVGGGVVDGLAVEGGNALNRLTVTPGTALDANGVDLELHDRDRHVRLADGRVVDGIRLQWRDGDDATATVDVLDDLAPLREAIAVLATDRDDASPLSRQPFNRARLAAAVFARLGMSGHTACCDDDPRFPPADVEPAAPDAPARGPAKPFAAFFPQCGGCHATGETSPPNFLAGSGAQVAARLRHCAPRLYVRVAMWRRDPSHREKTPMPPPFPSATGKTASAPRQAAELERIAAGLLREETGRAPRLDALLANGYEALRPCLPPAAG